MGILNVHLRISSINRSGINYKIADVMSRENGDGSRPGRIPRTGLASFSLVKNKMRRRDIFPVSEGGAI